MITQNTNSSRMAWMKMLGVFVLTGIASLGVLVVFMLMTAPFGALPAPSLQSLFAINTVQAWWYITRAAGLTAYFLLWLSMVWGMAITSRIFHPALEGTYSYDFHEYLSILGLGFVLLHVIVLLFDRYLPFSIWQIAIPFIDSYRPLWVGLGIIGFYGFALVTVTFYLRRSIGTRTFRTIHYLSMLAYLGATLHGLFAGTDSALPVTRWLYGGSFLVIVFLTVYWLAILGLNKREEARRSRQAQRYQPTALAARRRLKPR